MKKGFTLLELLIVIAILAILTTVVAITLNPAQLLAQARDSQRLADLSSLNAALGLYVASASTTLAFGSTGPNCTAAGTSPFSSGSCTTNASTTVDGTGWVPVNFKNISSGSPLSKLPIDPVNSTTLFYAWKGETGNFTWELDTVLESNKYKGLMSSDGGDNTSWYEIGSFPGLNI